RAYRPSTPRASRALDAGRTDEPIRTLTAAASTRSTGENVDDEPDDGWAWVDRRDPNPARVEAGAAARGGGDLDPLAFGVLRLDGEGADDVFRAAVCSTLLRCLP